MSGEAHASWRGPLAAFTAGLVFGVGLVIARMTSPLKVLAFLDVAGDWDPSLALVMAGALATTWIGFRALRNWRQPLYDTRFHDPSATRIDRRLLLGAALFGVGWGMTGYCPGPAIATLLTGNTEAWLVVPAMLLGGALERWWRQRHAVLPMQQDAFALLGTQHDGPAGSTESTKTEA